MTTITITEALAELKVISKRIESKQKFINEHLYRQEKFRDPLEKQGGSITILRHELQSIRDLFARITQIRVAIAKSNSQTSIELNSSKKTIEEWLFWRREVAPRKLDLLKQLQNKIFQMRKEAQEKGIQVVLTEATKPDDVIVNLDEKNLSEEIEAVEVLLASLDGKLSLKNATTTIDL